MSTIIVGDVAEGVKYWSVVDHLKRQLAQRYAKTNPYMSQWVQLSADAKVFINLVAGQPRAFIYTGVADVFIALKDLVLQGNTINLYKKLADYTGGTFKQKASYHVSHKYWKGKGEQALSWAFSLVNIGGVDHKWLDLSIGGRYNHKDQGFGVIGEPSEGITIMAACYINRTDALLATYPWMINYSRTLVFLTEDWSDVTPVYAIKMVGADGMYILGETRSYPLELPPLPVDLGLEASWFASGFSEDGKSIALASMVEHSSTRQEAHILTFSNDYTTYTTDKIYDELITHLSTTGTRTMATVLQPEDYYTGTYSTTSSTTLNNLAPYLIAISMEDTGVCALRHQIDVFTSSSSHTEVTTESDRSITESGASSFANTLDVIGFTKSGTDPWAYTVKTAYSSSTFTSSFTFSQSGDTLQAYSQDSNSIWSTDVTYYSARDSLMVFTEQIKDQTASIASRSTHEEEACHYSFKNNLTTVVSEVSDETLPFTPTPMTYRGLTESYSWTSNDSNASHPNVLSIWNNSAYVKTSANNKSLLLYCFNLLDDITINAHPHTLFLDISKLRAVREVIPPGLLPLETVLVPERIDFVRIEGGHQLIFNPTSITQENY